MITSFQYKIKYNIKYFKTKINISAIRRETKSGFRLEISSWLREGQGPSTSTKFLDILS